MSSHTGWAPSAKATPTNCTATLAAAETTAARDLHHAAADCMPVRSAAQELVKPTKPCMTWIWLHGAMPFSFCCNRSCVHLSLSHGSDLESLSTDLQPLLPTGTPNGSSSCLPELRLAPHPPLSLLLLLLHQQQVLVPWGQNHHVQQPAVQNSSSMPSSDALDITEHAGLHTKACTPG